ncbi:MAG: nuclear transport factor 2 family protein [Myxococcota bacterium]
MSDPVQVFLDHWHRIVRERDIEALGAFLAPDVTLGAPPYWDKLQGREMVRHLLGLVIHTIEDFTYHREWTQGRELALEFTGHVGDLEVQGIDLITLDDGQHVANLDVLMRPVNAVVALREIIAPQMLRYLAEARHAGSSS